MKSSLVILLIVLFFLACNSSTRNNEVIPTPIITIDSSEFNGRLYVYTYDFFNNNVMGNSDVYLYVNYNDIARNLWLNTIRTSAGQGEADFGFLLQGNYYLVANNGFKRDTAMVQVLGKRIIKRNLFLR
ncbi:MAG: hypothetical protein FGM41_11165 [Bacteroidetes bacterium]|jgi:hypothetical protein|nr:hypothetical protein [Bacteroidota bacterium]